jgi:signal transduction histidine kinase
MSAAWHADPGGPISAEVGRIAWWRSIRVRLAVALAVVATLLVGVFGLLAARTVLASARDQQREIAITDLRAATAAYTFSGQVVANVSVGRAGVPHALTRVLGPGVLATWDDGHQLWAAHELTDGSVLVSRYPDAPIRQRWEGLRSDILRLAGMVAALACLAGWLLASGFTRRIRSAAAAAQRISQGELTDRVAESGADEITVLAVAVNSMTDELVRRIEHERALTADAAHELRTPLTALVSATELLGEGPDADRVRRSTTRLRTLVEDLLRLAHLENESTQRELTSVELGPFVRDVLDDLPGHSGETVSVGASARVGLDPEGARRALENLVANSARHGRLPLHVAVDGATVVIEDSGSGFPAELLASGPRRFHPHGPSGHTGLGLTIVVRELASMGARLTLTNGERGARATICFPYASMRLAGEQSAVARGTRSWT